MRRLTAASDAKALGYGGVSLISRASGLSRKAIRKGIQEIETGVMLQGRIRRPGGGRKAITTSGPKLVCRLEAIVDAQTSQRSQDMLDQADLGGRLSESGSPGSPGDALDTRRNDDRWRQISTDEDDAAVGQRRQKPDANRGAGHEADAAHLGGPPNGSLPAMTDDSHGKSSLGTRNNE